MTMPAVAAAVLTASASDWAAEASNAEHDGDDDAGGRCSGADGVRLGLGGRRVPGLFSGRLREAVARPESGAKHGRGARPRVARAVRAVERLVRAQRWCVVKVRVAVDDERHRIALLPAVQVDDLLHQAAEVGRELDAAFRVVGAARARAVGVVLARGRPEDAGRALLREGLVQDLRRRHARAHAVVAVAGVRGQLGVVPDAKGEGVLVGRLEGDAALAVRLREEVAAVEPVFRRGLRLVVVLDRLPVHHRLAVVVRHAKRVDPAGAVAGLGAVAVGHDHRVVAGEPLGRVGHLAHLDLRGHPLAEATARGVIVVADIASLVRVERLVDREHQRGALDLRTLRDGDVLEAQADVLRAARLGVVAYLEVGRALVQEAGARLRLAGDLLVLLDVVPLVVHAQGLAVERGALRAQHRRAVADGERGAVLGGLVRPRVLGGVGAVERLVRAHGGGRRVLGAIGIVIADAVDHEGDAVARRPAIEVDDLIDHAREVGRHRGRAALFDLRLGDVLALRLPEHAGRRLLVPHGREDARADGVLAAQAAAAAALLLERAGVDARSVRIRVGLRGRLAVGEATALVRQPRLKRVAPLVVARGLEVGGERAILKVRARRALLHVDAPVRAEQSDRVAVVVVHAARLRRAVAVGRDARVRRGGVEPRPSIRSLASLDLHGEGRRPVAKVQALPGEGRAVVTVVGGLVDGELDVRVLHRGAGRDIDVLEADAHVLRGVVGDLNVIAELKV